MTNIWCKIEEEPVGWTEGCADAERDGMRGLSGDDAGAASLWTTADTDCSDNNAGLLRYGQCFVQIGFRKLYQKYQQTTHS